MSEQLELFAAQRASSRCYGDFRSEDHARNAVRFLWPFRNRGARGFIQRRLKFLRCCRGGVK